MPDAPLRFDTTYLHARKEAVYILLAFFVCLVWTVGYSSVAGYGVPVEQMTLVLGMPSWIVWGVMLPWLAATAFSVWFGLFYMKDDPLGGVDRDVSGDRAPDGDGRR